LDAIEDDVRQGGCIIDWHACDMFPARWIDLVVVLRTDSATLYDRLVGRKYPEAKLQENLDSEIMDVLIQEAREAFDEDIVVELQSVSTENMESNVGRIIAWIKQWKKDHDGRSTNDEDEGVDEANGGEDKEEDDDEDADENDDDDDENDDDEGEEDEDNYEDEKGQGKETSVVAKREGALKTVE
jgi:cobalamin biosynthesis protein CobT